MMTAPMFACLSQFVKLREAAPTREPHHKINLAQFDQLYQVSINEICSNFSKMLFSFQFIIFNKVENFSKRASKRWAEMSVLDGTKMDVKSGHKQKWFVCRKAPVSCIWPMYCISCILYFLKTHLSFSSVFRAWVKRSSLFLLPS